jgi:putative copper export protein
MIEVIGALFRWLQLASNMILIGGCVFLAIAVRTKTAFDAPWLARLERALPWLSVTLLLGLLGLATTTAQVTGVAQALGDRSLVGALLEYPYRHMDGTRALPLLLFGAAPLRSVLTRARWRYVLCATVAALTLAVASLASHSAADELSVTSVLPYALHIILASVWFGGLPAFLTALFAATGKRSHEEADWSSIQILKRFSAMALPVMIAVVATGIIVADHGGHELRLVVDELRLVSQYKACAALGDSRSPHAHASSGCRARPERRCGCGRREDFEGGHRRSRARGGAGVGGDNAGERRTGKATSLVAYPFRFSIDPPGAS